MKEIIQRMRRHLDAIRATKEERRKEEIRSRFSIHENDGSIYLCCGSIAIRQFSDDVTATTIVSALKECRAAAIIFNLDKQ